MIDNPYIVVYWNHRATNPKTLLQY